MFGNILQKCDGKEQMSVFYFTAHAYIVYVSNGCHGSELTDQHAELNWMTTVYPWFTAEWAVPAQQYIRSLMQKIKLSGLNLNKYKYNYTIVHPKANLICCTHQHYHSQLLYNDSVLLSRWQTNDKIGRFCRTTKNRPIFVCHTTDFIGRYYRR